MAGRSVSRRAGRHHLLQQLPPASPAGSSETARAPVSPRAANLLQRFHRRQWAVTSASRAAPLPGTRR